MYFICADAPDRLVLLLLFFINDRHIQQQCIVLIDISVKIRLKVRSLDVSSHFFVNKIKGNISCSYAHRCSDNNVIAKVFIKSSLFFFGNAILFLDQIDFLKKFEDKRYLNHTIPDDGANDVEKNVVNINASNA